MKRTAIFLAALCSALLAGCATDMSRYYDVAAKAVEADNNAVMGLAAAAAQGNQGAIMALALRQGQAGKIAPPQDKALQWASILVPGATGLMNAYWNYKIQGQNIEASTERYGLTMGAFGTLAGQGIEAAAKDPLVIQPTIVHVPAGGSVTSP